MVVGGDCDDDEGEGDEGLGFDIEIYSWNERLEVSVELEIESSGHLAHNLLRYGSWGEPCACILWYREKRGERLEIYSEGISPCSRTVFQTCNTALSTIERKI
jgi:hypothetical protein